MKSVRRENTAPELVVRSYLHTNGLRYSLHHRDLPGTPDLVLARRRTVIFVHGCFWHGHDCEHGSVRSKTNAEFWNAKLAANRARDEHKAAALRALGWFVEVVWECDLDRPDRLKALVRRLRRR